MTETITRPRIRDGRSALATPSPYYVGYWPMTQFNSAGSFDKITIVNSGNVDTSNDYIAGFSSAPAGLGLGAHVRVRASAGALPGGLSPFTNYYLGIPGGNTDRRTYHLSQADAIAGTNKVDITSVSAPNSTITYVFPDNIRDDSGQANHLTLGVSLTDLSLYSDPPYLSSGSSASADVIVGRLPVATLNSYWQWPDSFLFCCHMKLPAPAAAVGRAFAGVGMPSSSDGPRMSVGSVDTSKLNCQMYYGGSGVSAQTLFQSNFSPIVEDEPFHFAVLFDGYTQQGFEWVDGELDIGSQYRSLSAVTTVNPTGDFCIGGVSTPNSTAMSFRDVHLFSIPRAIQPDIPKITRLINRLACGYGYRVMDGDI